MHTPLTESKPLASDVRNGRTLGGSICSIRITVIIQGQFSVSVSHVITKILVTPLGSKAANDMLHLNELSAVHTLTYDVCPKFPDDHDRSAQKQLGLDDVIVY